MIIWSIVIFIRDFTFTSDITVTGDFTFLTVKVPLKVTFGHFIRNFTFTRVFTFLTVKEPLKVTFGHYQYPSHSHWGGQTNLHDLVPTLRGEVYCLLTYTLDLETASATPPAASLRPPRQTDWHHPQPLPGVSCLVHILG